MKKTGEKRMVLSLALVAALLLGSVWASVDLRQTRVVVDVDPGDTAWLLWYRYSNDDSEIFGPFTEDTNLEWLPSFGTWYGVFVYDVNAGGYTQVWYTYMGTL